MHRDLTIINIHMLHNRPSKYGGMAELKGETDKSTAEDFSDGEGIQREGQ